MSTRRKGPFVYYSLADVRMLHAIELFTAIFAEKRIGWRRFDVSLSAFAKKGKHYKSRRGNDVLKRKIQQNARPRATETSAMRKKSRCTKLWLND
jgi:hypothetical protein